MEYRDVRISDARRLEGSRRRRLEVHGLELLNRPLQRPDLHFFDNRQLVQEYYLECAEIVRGATNAAHVFAFDHNIRRTPGKEIRRRIAGGQQVQKPIHVAHGDYTLVSAPQRLRDLAKPPGMNDTLRSVLRDGGPLLSAELVSRTLDEHRRFALINVWRNIDRSHVMADPWRCATASAWPQMIWSYSKSIITIVSGRTTLQSTHRIMNGGIIRS